MRAVKINPLTKEITEVEYTGDYKNIYTHIESTVFDIVRFGDDDNHCVYIDDEGLINGTAQSQGFFRVEGDYPIALAGCGLILASDNEGECVACTLSLDYLKEKITFGIPVRINGLICFAEHETGKILRLA